MSCINVAENVRVARLPSNQSIQIGQLPIILIFQLTFWLSNQILKKKVFYFRDFDYYFFLGGKTNERMIHRFFEPCLMTPMVPMGPVMLSITVVCCLRLIWFFAR